MQGDQANSEAAERLGEAEAVEVGEAEATPSFQELREVRRAGGWGGQKPLQTNATPGTGPVPGPRGPALLPSWPGRSQARTVVCSLA